MARVTRVNKTYSVTWEEALRQFVWQKKAEGLQDCSWQEYDLMVRLFLRRHPDAWEPGRLQPACFEFMSQSVRPATYNHRLTYLKHFFAWCLTQGFIKENPFSVLKKRKDEGRDVNLDASLLSDLLTLPGTKTFAGLRDKALLLLSLDTGIRPKEAFCLQAGDVNFRSLEVYIRSAVAKTGVARTLPISEVTAKAIAELIRVRHPSWDAGVPVFCTADGTRLNRNSWNDRLEAYSRQLGGKIRPYDLRHDFALQYLRNGGHLLALQRTMGHADLATTKRYVKLAESDLVQQHSFASPLNTFLPKKGRVRRVR